MIITETKKIPMGEITRLLELIADTNKIIQTELKAGEQEEGLTIRQFKHLKSKFVQELDEKLKEIDLDLTLSLAE